MPTQSLSARRAWIEITIVSTPFLLFTVALRKESVDRNIVTIVQKLGKTIVALRKESVDRNCGCLLGTALYAVSLSARRAWIEICVSTR